MSTKQGSEKLPIVKDAHVTDAVPSIPRTASNSSGLKRMRTSPKQSTTTPDNISTIAKTSLRKPTTPTGKSPKKQKTAASDESSAPLKNSRACELCGCSSVKDDFNSLRKDLEQRVLGPIEAQLEKLNRDCHGLSRSVLRIAEALTKLAPDFDLNDKLKDSARAATSPQLGKAAHSILETNKKATQYDHNSDTFMDIESGNAADMYPSRIAVKNPSPSTAVPSQHWGKMHNDRILQIKKTNLADANSKVPTNNQEPYNPDARLDREIKEWAFSTSFQLPLEPRGTFNARITTFDGDLVATGYDRIVADGESIWFEVPKAELNLTKFQPRQRTPSRNFYTLSGVTAHEQLQTEIGRSPRRHKLAVKVKRNLPCCRLTPDKWYVHAHQVKIETDHSGKLRLRRLKTKRLISILRSVFGRAYFPRLNSSKPKTQQRRTRVEPKKPIFLKTR